MQGKFTSIYIYIAIITALCFITGPQFSLISPVNKPGRLYSMLRKPTQIRLPGFSNRVRSCQRSCVRLFTDGVKHQLAAVGRVSGSGLFANNSLYQSKVSLVLNCILLLIRFPQVSSHALPHTRTPTHTLTDR